MAPVFALGLKSKWLRCKLHWRKRACMVLKANGGAAYVDGASAHARLVLKENGGAAYFVGASVNARS